MPPFLDRVLPLWLAPPTDDAAAVAAFREVYADPVSVNGAELAVADLVARARALHRAYADVRIELVDQLETPDRVVLAFRMRGRHVGPLATPLGVVAPTGREVETRVADVFTIRGGRVTRIWMVGDELGTLMQLGAVHLTPR